MNIKLDAFSLIPITNYILVIVKSILIIVLMIKGIKVANIYIKNNEDKREE